MEHVTVFFRDAAGAVTSTRLMPLDATHAAQNFPWQWSYSSTGFASVPNGDTAPPSGTPAGGIGGLLSTTSKAG